MYGTTSLATSWPPREPWQVRILRALLWFIPRANPDNEKLYPRVHRWALELDEDRKPVREVGVGANGKALFRAPDKRNYGFWTDNAQAFEIDILETMNPAAFEALWAEVPSHEA